MASRQESPLPRGSSSSCGHIARHALVPSTHLSRLGELDESMGLSVLETSAKNRVVQSLVRSLRDKCKELSDKGVSPRLEATERLTQSD